MQKAQSHRRQAMALAETRNGRFGYLSTGGRRGSSGLRSPPSGLRPRSPSGRTPRSPSGRGPRSPHRACGFGRHHGGRRACGGRLQQGGGLLASGLAELIPFALGIGAALAVRRAATGLVEVISRWTTDVTALTTSTLATLATLHAGARSHVGHHRAQALDGFLGELLAHLRERGRGRWWTQLPAWRPP